MFFGLILVKFILMIYFAAFSALGTDKELRESLFQQLQECVCLPYGFRGKSVKKVCCNLFEKKLYVWKCPGLAYTTIRVPLAYISRNSLSITLISSLISKKFFLVMTIVDDTYEDGSDGESDEDGSE